MKNRQASTSNETMDSDVSFKSIDYRVDDRVAHIKLNRPERFNAIDEHMPGEIQSAVQKANNDESVKVILLYGANNVFCSGYDLKQYAEAPRGTAIGSQKMPWDPYVDYQLMWQATEDLMSLWRSLKPVICKIEGVAIGGGSDMALCCDITVMAEEAKIGYPPARVWGCPTTAMWVYRVGAENAKRILLTGDLLSGTEAANVGLVGEAVPQKDIDERVETLVKRMVTVPSNQLWFQKQVINNAVEQMGLLSTQRMATLFDGMSRHTPEGVAFQKRVQEVGFKTAVKERDSGEDIMKLWGETSPSSKL